jgi:PEP-CTERM motif-containing protein
MSHRLSAVAQQRPIATHRVDRHVAAFTSSIAVLLASLLIAVLGVGSASATPAGTLSLASSTAVTIGLTIIDWGSDGPPDGPFVVGTDTDIVTTSGNPRNPDGGIILDLVTGGVPAPNFLTFPLSPGLHFDLTTLGPGAANTDCAAAVNTGDTCSPWVGAPYVLTRIGATGTTVTLSLDGLAVDGSGASPFSGVFSASISTLTPLQIQQAFGCQSGQTAGECTSPDATIQSTYAGELTAEILQAPEPSTVSLIGAGLIAFGCLARRARKPGTNP